MAGRSPAKTKVKVSGSFLTTRISMSDFLRRANRLSKWFERSRHAVAFDVVFARVDKTLWHDRQWQRVLLSASLGKEDCVSVIGAPGARCWKFEYP
jgi:hypothetical protein